MLRVLEVTFPIFALVFCGFLAQRRRLLPAGAVEGLNAVVFLFALPAMLFRVVATQPIANFTDWRFAGGYLGASLLLFVLARQSTLGWPLRRTEGKAPQARSRATAFGLHVTHGNVGYLGVPLVVELGRQYVPTMIMVIICDTFVIIALSLALLEIDRRHLSDRGHPERDTGAPRVSVALTIAGGLVRSPLVLAIAAGLGWSLAANPLPAFADSFTRILAGASGPCALFAIGASLGDRRVVVDRVVAALVAAKLLVHPVLAAALLTLAGCSPLVVSVGVLAASLPGASNSYIIARRYDVDTRDISAAILVGTIVALGTVSAVIWLFGFR